MQAFISLPPTRAPQAVGPIGLRNQVFQPGFYELPAYLFGV
jgi:hypothetical protein